MNDTDAPCVGPAAPGPYCIESFGRITGQLGRMSAKLDAIHEQTVRTNGHVAALYDRTGRHETEIQLLRAGAADARRGRNAWARRVWQLAVGVALLLAGYFLKT
jgi:hypothetical protein